MATEVEHDSSGWFNYCMGRNPDGSLCEKRVWIAFNHQQRRGIRFEPDKTTPHDHEVVARTQLPPQQQVFTYGERYRTFMGKKTSATDETKAPKATNVDADETARRERILSTQGIVMIAKYKGEEYRVSLDGEAWVDGSGQTFKSLSDAGKKFTSNAVNGWRFFREEGVEPAPKAPRAKKTASESAVAAEELDPAIVVAPEGSAERIEEAEAQDAEFATA